MGMVEAQRGLCQTRVPLHGLATGCFFKVKVVKVNTFTTTKGEKRAYIKFGDDTPAIDVATQLGLM